MATFNPGDGCVDVTLTGTVGPDTLEAEVRSVTDEIDRTDALTPSVANDGFASTTFLANDAGTRFQGQPLGIRVTGVGQDATGQSILRLRNTNDDPVDITLRGPDGLDRDITLPPNTQIFIESNTSATQGFQLVINGAQTINGVPVPDGAVVDREGVNPNQTFALNEGSNEFSVDRLNANGGESDDALIGLSCDDTLIGGEGADSLTGGLGVDQLTGDGSGADGADTFFGSANELDGDSITDLGQSDRILLIGGSSACIVSYDSVTGALVVDVAGDTTGTANTADDITISLPAGLDGTFAITASATDGVIAFTSTTTGGAGGGTGTGTGGAGGGGTGQTGPCLPGLVLEGTVASEALVGTADSDTLRGLEGNDTLSGEACRDMIFAGAGDDVAFGGAEDDVMTGDEGADTLFAGEGDDEAFGGADADVVGGGDGADVVGGGSGADIVYGGSGDDTLYGAQGADTVYGGTQADKIFTHGDGDVIGDGGGDDEIGAGRGDDEIQAGNGADTIYAAAGDDTIFAGSGSDSVFGGSGDDLVFLGAGDSAQDVYSSTADNGSDTIFGFEDGMDRLNLAASGLTSFDRIAARLGEDLSGNVTIDLGNENVLTLVGIARGQLDETDFQF
ncbi:MAG: calcium-binding protein [Pseudomonadota bacterium]